MDKSTFISEKKVKHLNIDRDILAKYYPNISFNDINQTIEYLDYRHYVTNEEYVYHKFDKFPDDIQIKLDTLFYMVFLKSKGDYEDFLYGMRYIMPNEDINDNEKDLLESKIFFYRHAQEFCTRLKQLIIWRNSDLSNLSITLSQAKGKSTNNNISDITIDNYPFDRRLFDDAIYHHLNNYLSSPFANVQYFAGKLDDISIDAINDHYNSLEEAINIIVDRLDKLKEKSAKERNSKKQIVKGESNNGAANNKLKAFNIYRGRSTNLVFQNYIYEFVIEFFKKEGLTFENTTRKLPNNLRYVKLITYEMLAQLGVISSQKINDHQTVAIRETYIANLPSWKL